MERYTQHMSSFQVHDHRNSTSLSKKVKELQRKHTLFDVKWKIIETSSPYRGGCQECRLCVTEVYHILFSPADSTLNSRSEFTNKCRHQNKFKLSSIQYIYPNFRSTVICYCVFVLQIILDLRIGLVFPYCDHLTMKQTVVRG